MEKQTKILLGIGAVIAAYLILKPKKAKAQYGYDPLGTCPDGLIYNSSLGCVPKSPTSPSQNYITSDLDIHSLTRKPSQNDSDTSPYHSSSDASQQYTYVDKEGNMVYKNVALYNEAGNNWSKTIADKNGGWIISYDINGKYISSHSFSNTIDEKVDYPQDPKYVFDFGWNKTQVENNNSNADDLAVFA